MSKLLTQVASYTCIVNMYCDILALMYCPSGKSSDFAIFIYKSCWVVFSEYLIECVIQDRDISVKRTSLCCIFLGGQMQFVNKQIYFAFSLTLEGRNILQKLLCYFILNKVYRYCTKAILSIRAIFI